MTDPAVARRLWDASCELAGVAPDLGFLRT
jgi:hypothetical protein